MEICRTISDSTWRIYRVLLSLHRTHITHTVCCHEMKVFFSLLSTKLAIRCSKQHSATLFSALANAKMINILDSHEIHPFHIFSVVSPFYFFLQPVSWHNIIISTAGHDLEYRSLILTLLLFFLPFFFFYKIVLSSNRFRCSLTRPTW